MLYVMHSLLKERASEELSRKCIVHVHDLLEMWASVYYSNGEVQ